MRGEFAIEQEEGTALLKMGEETLKKRGELFQEWLNVRLVIAEKIAYSDLEVAMGNIEEEKKQIEYSEALYRINEGKRRSDLRAILTEEVGIRRENLNRV